MTRNRTLLALVASQLIALGAIAQSDAEFGRASGGTIDAITKAPRQLSGSLALSHSTRGEGYEGSLGGQLVPDRLWFFASASVLPNMQFSNADLTAVDAKATAQPVDWSTVTASFSQSRQPAFFASPALPTSFLSLRSTSMVSDRMMLNFSFSRSTGTR